MIYVIFEGPPGRESIWILPFSLADAMGGPRPASLALRDFVGGPSPTCGFGTPHNLRYCALPPAGSGWKAPFDGERRPIVQGRPRRKQVRVTGEPCCQDRLVARPGPNRARVGAHPVNVGHAPEGLGGRPDQRELRQLEAGPVDHHQAGRWNGGGKV